MPLLANQRDAIRERRPVYLFQDECLDALGLLQPVDVPDVGMVQRGQDFGFTLEPGQPIWIVREGLRQDLECHVPVELGVPCAIHLAHAAFADLGGDGIRPEAGAWIEHGCRVSADYRVRHTTGDPERSRPTSYRGRDRYKSRYIQDSQTTR